MLKPQMPSIPGAAVVNDTLDFVKNLWGSMSVPGVGLPTMAPTLSVDELDKKIADLKAVEAWLALNASMLRGTIQALEVQRGTINTLKSMGSTLANAVKQPGANEKTVLEAAPYAKAFFQGAEEKKAVEPAPAAKPVAAKPAAKKAQAKPAVAPDTSALANPTVWWNLLQDQFKGAVAAATSPTAAADLTKAVGKTLSRAAAPAPKPAAAKKPAAKKPAAKRAPRKTA